MSENRLTIIYGGDTVFDGDVDKIEFNHRVHRSIDPLGLEQPAPATVTLAAEYPSPPRRPIEWPTATAIEDLIKGGR